MSLGGEAASDLLTLGFGVEAGALLVVLRAFAASLIFGRDAEPDADRFFGLGPWRRLLFHWLPARVYTLRAQSKGSKRHIAVSRVNELECGHRWFIAHHETSQNS